ncbi:MAG: DUF1028 domain-containing protein, partial [Dehalococcoidia bacterium]
MTFTIIGRCPRTGRLGIGITTLGLAVGALCCNIKPKVGAVVPQANVNPNLALLAMDLMEKGYSLDKVLQELESADALIEYRQLGIVDSEGNAVARTGGSTRPWAGHIVGNGYVAMGNVLAGEQVVQAIGRAFEGSLDQELDERLLLAIEAGRDAGGQRGANGQHLPEHSAALLVYEDEDIPLSQGWMDLRVDAHDTAVAELRRLRDMYKPHIPYH